MTDRNRPDAVTHGDGPPLFAATLTPHRSLGPRGFLVLMAAFGFACFLAGLRFYALGAWPVVGFLGLDVVLLWAAFALSFRAARAYEVVEVSRTALVIRKVAPSGRAQEFSFNPAWVRLSIERDAERGVTGIAVHARGAAVPVGAFLNPADRTDFARAFGAALAAARA